MNSQHVSSCLSEEGSSSIIPRYTLGADVKKQKPTVIINPTCYDGSVELAAIQMGMASVSCSTNGVYFKCANEIVKGHLLKAS